MYRHNITLNISADSIKSFEISQSGVTVSSNSYNITCSLTIYNFKNTAFTNLADIVHALNPDGNNVDLGEIVILENGFTMGSQISVGTNSFTLHNLFGAIASVHSDKIVEVNSDNY